MNVGSLVRRKERREEEEEGEEEDMVAPTGGDRVWVGGARFKNLVRRLGGGDGYHGVVTDVSMSVVVVGRSWRSRALEGEVARLLVTQSRCKLIYTRLRKADFDCLNILALVSRPRCEAPVNFGMKRVLFDVSIS